MKKLLYITANPKPENLSSSKTIGRQLVNTFLKQTTDYTLEEVDLYEDHIPQLKHIYYESRSTLISPDKIEKLESKDQKEVQRIIALCDQFRSADVYILAAPMWSLSFPAPVKEYLDCIIQANRTIEFDNEKPHGILDDKTRTFVYVQSSGGNIPWIMRPILNKGLNYVHDMMKFIGISNIEELLVDGTGANDIQTQQALEIAKAKIDGVVEKMIL
ncbi:MAG TPA: NAD(P)H-dependent oxidoreductase [Desulfosporosinus sp.]|nr:NAD(P)H-dependent oxidoreductase [Desulfosporosinus sp.]